LKGWNVQKINLLSSSLRKLFRNKIFITGFSLYLALILFSIVGSLITPIKLTYVGAAEPLLPPQLHHPLGTDILGRDILALLYSATLNSGKIGLIAAAIGTLIGALIGFISGYYGGSIDFVLRMITDVFLSVPSLLFLILISSLVKTVSVEMMAFLISAFSWSWPARQVRAQALSLKESDFVYLAKLSGESGFEIIIKELMPHMIPWMAANFVNAYLVAILTEAGLAILGLGPQTEMTLGILLWWALNHAAIFRGIWWWWFPPVALLIYSFLALYLMQIGLTEVINPRAKVI